MESLPPKPQADDISLSLPGPLFDSVKSLGKKGKTVGKVGGTSAARLAGLLKRDHPAIVLAVERGEYPSMRQAAKGRGIKRNYNQIDKDDPGQIAAQLKKLCTATVVKKLAGKTRSARFGALQTC